MKLLAIRVDAGPAIGMGHVMRSIAIAESWSEVGGSVLFVMAHGAEALRGRIALMGARVIAVDVQPGTADDIAMTLRTTKEYGAAVVLLDGYAFALDFQQAIVDEGFVCAVVDDHARLTRYAADVLVDPNVTADASLLGERTRGRVLAGLSYALIRREFRTLADTPTQPHVGRRVLVTFGGADPARLTERALQTLGMSHDLRVVVGETNEHGADIEKRAREMRNALVLRGARSMAEHMRWSDVTLAAAGTTCSELAYMGVPALVVVTADNQRPVAEGFERLGTVRSLGDTNVAPDRMAAMVDDLLGAPGVRAAMAARGKAAIDGQGALRVARTLQEVAA